jgi:CrcB protein
LVFIGGTLGVLARAGLDHWFPTEAGFPVTTFVLNIAGALALAILVEMLAQRSSEAGHRRAARLLLGTGVLGGFTTYSALAVQTDTLLRAGEVATAFAYSGGTVALGFVASLAGVVLTRRVLAR